MHLLLIFPLAVIYLATKSKIALVALILIVLPTCIHYLFQIMNGGKWGDD